jgi:GTP-binding protein
MLSAAAPAQFPRDEGVEVAFAGRSNAGKSTAINAITQRNSLARTSKTPGRTQLLNFFELAAGKRLVDLPGYGYADVPEVERRKWAPLIEALGTRNSLRGLFLIVDSRRGLRDSDAGLIEWAGGRPLHVLLAKSDKLTRSEATKVQRASADALQGRATVQLFSAHGKIGIEEARGMLERWLAGADARN